LQSIRKRVNLGGYGGTSAVLLLVKNLIATLESLERTIISYSERFLTTKNVQKFLFF
jgi:hypothetical protein